MKVYGGEIKTGLRLLYNGEPIKWTNRSGKIVEVLKRGKEVFKVLKDTALKAGEADKAAQIDKLALAALAALGALGCQNPFVDELCKPLYNKISFK